MQRIKQSDQSNRLSTATRDQVSVLPYLVLTGGVLIVSTASILIRLAQQEGVGSLTIAAGRLGLAALLLRTPDLLLLDEPTNHLDFAALAWLESYLQTFRGGLLVVSHDRQFLRALATRVLELSAAGPRVYGGSYEEYVASTGREAPGMRAIE